MASPVSRRRVAAGVASLIGVAILAAVTGVWLVAHGFMP